MKPKSYLLFFILLAVSTITLIWTARIQASAGQVNGASITIRNVDWTQAVDLIQTGRVTNAYLVPKSRQVVLQLSDQYVQVVEPTNNTVHEQIEDCGQACLRVGIHLIDDLGLNGIQ